MLFLDDYIIVPSFLIKEHVASYIAKNICGVQGRIAEFKNGTYVYEFINKSHYFWLSPINAMVNYVYAIGKCGERIKLSENGLGETILARGGNISIKQDFINEKLRTCIFFEIILTLEILQRNSQCVFIYNPKSNSLSLKTSKRNFKTL